VREVGAKTKRLVGGFFLPEVHVGFHKTPAAADLILTVSVCPKTSEKYSSI
jgi:hypothetical protein